MKIEFANIWKHPDYGRFFILFPSVIFNVEQAEFSIAIGWLIWGVEFRFMKPTPKAKRYVNCQTPIPRRLTRGKEYEIIEEYISYYGILQDDGVEGLVLKDYFGEPFNKWQPEKK